MNSLVLTLFWHYTGTPLVFHFNHKIQLSELYYLRISTSQFSIKKDKQLYKKILLKQGH